MEGGEVRGRGHFLLNWCHFNFASHIWVCPVFQGWHCLVGISIGLSLENAEQDFLWCVGTAPQPQTPVSCWSFSSYSSRTPCGALSCLWVASRAGFWRAACGLSPAQSHLCVLLLIRRVQLARCGHLSVAAVPGQLPSLTSLRFPAESQMPALLSPAAGAKHQAFRGPAEASLSI